MALLLCAVISLANSVVSAQVSSDPARCCTDKQFHAVLTEMGGFYDPKSNYYTFLDSYSYLEVDYYQMRIGSDSYELRPDGKTYNTKRLWDYRTNKTYTVDHENKCIISRVEQPFESNCVPQRARFLPDFSYFGHGTEKMNLLAWEYVQEQTNWRVRRAFTYDCVPVLQEFYGYLDGQSINMVQFFSDFQPGLKNMAQLDIPMRGISCVDQTGN